MMQTGRPDPDKLLELVKADREVSRRGRLKIFFGAAAGVGKTYAMLSEARRLAFDEGRDVVIGIVEHHGRAETLSLIDGLTQLPPLEIEHRGVRLTEFDLEGALARSPSLILVDELAHSNAPGLRHPKRWLDVRALLDHGIDVFTTLNVQHLESVNDVVAKLTGIWVQETVPDLVFDEADEVALVDIPSDDLLQRLAAGKVYVGEGANRRAAEHFFRKANLTALRELALRRTADRVDAESDELNLALGQRGGSVTPRLLVLAGADLRSARLIRRARRMAVATKSAWTVLYLRTHEHERLTELGRLRLEKHLGLAEEFGAEVVRLPTADPAATALAYARQNGFARLIVGTSARRSWLVPWRRPLSQRLIEGGAGLEIVAVSDDLADPGAPAETRSVDGLGRADLLKLVWAVPAVAAATLCGWPFRGLADPNDISLLYLVAVVVSAVRFGIGPAIVTSVLSVAAFNFFFTEPYFSFRFDDPGYYFTFAFMLVTSLIVGSMTARINGHARQARKSEEDTQLLYALTRGLSAVRGVEAISDVAIARIREPYAVVPAIYVADDKGRLDVHPADTPPLDAREQGALQWVMESGDRAGRDTDTMPSARGLYLPLEAGGEKLGVLALAPRDERRRFLSAEILRLETIADLVAGALQRARRADEAEKSRVEIESERLRNVLLASLSHDLRTPLTVMNGSLGSLLKMRKKLPREAVEELTGLWGQLVRLQKFVGNLLKMAAITSGRLQLNFQPYLIQEIIGAAIAEVEPQKDGRTITASLSGAPPMVMMDGALIQQVLVNLLENAIAHTAADGTIAIHAARDADVLRVRVTDDGPGIPSGEEERIFDKFHGEGAGADRQVQGTGLGLAICRGIIGAHGGMIYAKNNPAAVPGTPAGASLIFTLPIGETREHG